MSSPSSSIAPIPCAEKHALDLIFEEATSGAVILSDPAPFINIGRCSLIVQRYAEEPAIGDLFRSFARRHNCQPCQPLHGVTGLVARHWETEAEGSRRDWAWLWKKGQRKRLRIETLQKFKVQTGSGRWRGFEIEKSPCVLEIMTHNDPERLCRAWLDMVHPKQPEMPGWEVPVLLLAGQVPRSPELAPYGSMAAAYAMRDVQGMWMVTYTKQPLASFAQGYWKGSVWTNRTLYDYLEPRPKT